MRLLRALAATATLVAATAAIASPTMATARPAHAATGGWVTSRASVSTDSAQANDGSLDPAISADGRYVTYASSATNLVSNDTNGQWDVFVRDRWTRRTTRVSTGPAGAEANGGSSDPKISANGRYIAFTSYASNLVTDDTNNDLDVFVHDTRTGATTLVSVSSTGEPGNSASYGPYISANGRYVTFSSLASNLVPGQNVPAATSTFVRDLATGTTSMVNVPYAGASPPTDSSLARAISATGRYVVMLSWESNLVPDDTNGVPDLFVRDLVAGVTTRVSLTDDDQQTSVRCDHPSISDDGRYVAFHSEDPALVPGDTNNAVDVFVRDVIAATTIRASISTAGAQADGVSVDPVLSRDGRTVVFASTAGNLADDDVNGRFDVFLRDLRTGRTTLVSRSTTGQAGDSDSVNPYASPDARHITFDSSASNLVSGDTNNRSDVFVRDRIG